MRAKCKPAHLYPIARQFGDGGAEEAVREEEEGEVLQLGLVATLEHAVERQRALREIKLEK